MMYSLTFQSISIHSHPSQGRKGESTLRFQRRYLDIHLEMNVDVSLISQLIKDDGGGQYKGSVLLLGNMEVHPIYIQLELRIRRPVIWTTGVLRVLG